MKVNILVILAISLFLSFGVDAPGQSVSELENLANQMDAQGQHDAANGFRKLAASMKADEAASNSSGDGAASNSEPTLQEKTMSGVASYIGDQVKGYVLQIEQNLGRWVITNSDAYQNLDPDQQADVLFNYDWSNPSLFLPGSDTAVDNFDKEAGPAIDQGIDQDPGDE